MSNTQNLYWGVAILKHTYVYTYNLLHQKHIYVQWMHVDSIRYNLSQLHTLNVPYHCTHACSETLTTLRASFYSSQLVKSPSPCSSNRHKHNIQIWQDFYSTGWNNRQTFDIFSGLTFTNSDLIWPKDTYKAILYCIREDF